MPALQMSLEKEEVRLLLQSLDHCLATCERKSSTGKDAPCEDCARAKALRERLAKLS